MDDSDTTFNNVLSIIHRFVWSSTGTSSHPESLVCFNQFKKNITKKSASGFINLLRKVLQEEDWSFWHPIVTYGTSPDLRWTGLSTVMSQFLDVFHRADPNDPVPSETRVARKLQEASNLTHSHSSV